jgi:hypothetical protein
MLHMIKTLSPSSKPPRVSVPVSGETLEVFKRLAKASNQSTGTAIAEWLSDTVEAAELMAATMERARAAPKVVTAELHAMMLGLADHTKELQDKYSKFKGSLASLPKDLAPAVALARTSDESFGKFAADLSKNGKVPPSCNTGGKVSGGKKPKPAGESS